ncbi:hypothetical protein EPN83_02805 [Patescibacteria group bacterium]|nr:MAG: hypothetical protein EPN83_02805 [Patescibacteria group bacterium]
MNKLIKQWHTILDTPKRDLEWHKQDVLDELAEFKEARGLINRWSELSDVVYTCTRAQWSGHEDIEFPLKKQYFYIGLFYMFPKYTLRWKFYRVLGKKFDNNLKISEVRNPMKIEKLEKIAKKYNLDPIRFKYEAERIMRSWVFLK